MPALEVLGAVSKGQQQENSLFWAVTEDIAPEKAVYYQAAMMLKA